MIKTVITVSPRQSLGIICNFAYLSRYPARKEERNDAIPTKDGSPASRIEIKFLPPHIRKPHILDFVMTVSKRAPIDIYIQHKAGYPVTTFGLVTFDTIRDAVICIRELDRKLLEGHRVRIIRRSPDLKEMPWGTRAEHHHRRNVELEYGMEWKRMARQMRNETEWIEWSNLPRTVDEQHILNHIRSSELLEQPPKDILLFQHPKHAEYPGFARIQCASKEDATKLVEGLHLSELHGQRIWMEWKRVDFAYPEASRLNHRYRTLKGRTKCLELLNLDHTVDSETKLERLFTRCRLPMYHNVVLYRFPNGFMQRRAVIEMETNEEADEVWDKLHGERVRGSVIWVDYRPMDFGEAQFARKYIMENRERERCEALERLKLTGDARSEMEKMKDRVAGGPDWRKQRFLAQTRIHKGDVLKWNHKLMPKKRVKIDLEEVDVKGDKKGGILKSTLKYGTVFQHRRSELKGMKRTFQYQISERWGTKYLE